MNWVPENSHQINPPLVNYPPGKFPPRGSVSHLTNFFVHKWWKGGVYTLLTPCTNIFKFCRAIGSFLVTLCNIKKNFPRNILSPLYKMNYLRMRKRQFWNTAYNLLTKFHKGKISPFLFSNFFTWYEVKT